MSIIEQIKAEIDKRYTEYSKKMKTNDFTYYEGMADALDLFEQFIDTLESEKPIPKDLEEAAEDFVWEVMENDEDGISDLCRKLRPTSKISDFYDALAEFFIAGAKWDREQMLKEAVEGEVSQANDGWKSLKLPSTFFGELSRKYEVGDKVRIIIVKED